MSQNVLPSSAAAAHSSSSSSHSATAKCSSNKLDLNSTNFDAEEYVRNLLHEKGIDDLVAVEEDMVKNVRWLDAEMRELVYENYNKFLMATQAVRNMQDRLSNMRQDVGSLSKKISAIAAQANELNQKFSANSELIEALREEKRISDTSVGGGQSVSDDQTKSLPESE